MKRILLLLISLMTLQIKASADKKPVKGEIEKIFDFGKEIQQELEKNLALEFKRCSDSIFEQMKNIEDDVSLIQKRFKANCSVDLMKVLDTSMNLLMTNMIGIFLIKAETERNKLLAINRVLFNKWRDGQKNNVIWPHSQQLFGIIRMCGLRYSPMMIRRDRIVCDEKTCEAEVFGLQEDNSDPKNYKSDRPEYFHKITCKLIRLGIIPINAHSDSVLSVQQRIKFAFNNFQFVLENINRNNLSLSDLQKKILENYKINHIVENYPDLSEELGEIITDANILKIISDYCPNLKLSHFIDFYNCLDEMRSFVLVEKFIANEGTR